MSRFRSVVVNSRRYLASIGFGALLGIVLFAISFVIRQRLTWTSRATWPEIAYGLLVVLFAVLTANVGDVAAAKRVVNALLIASAALLTIHGIPYIADPFRGKFWYPLLSVSLIAFVEIVMISGLGSFLLSMIPAKNSRRLVALAVAFVLFMGALSFWRWRAATSSEIAEEEYEVYSAVLEQSFPNGFKAILSDNTTIPVDSLGYHPAAGSLLAPFAILDFQAKNLRKSPLQVSLIRQSSGLLVSEAQYRKTSQDRRRMDALYEAYPNGVLWLSRVGFDPVTRTAVVYAGNQFGNLGGEGDIIVLSKLSGHWRIQHRIPQWFI